MYLVRPIWLQTRTHARTHTRTHARTHTIRLITLFQYYFIEIETLPAAIKGRICAYHVSIRYVEHQITHIFFKMNQPLIICSRRVLRFTNVINIHVLRVSCTMCTV